MYFIPSSLYYYFGMHKIHIALQKNQIFFQRADEPLYTDRSMLYRQFLLHIYHTVIPKKHFNEIFVNLPIPNKFE